MTQDIHLALKNLDTENNDHWTNEGLPKVTALNINGLARKDVTAAAPHFTRTNPTLELPDIIVSEDAELDARLDAIAEFFDADSVEDTDDQTEDEQIIYAVYREDGTVITTDTLTNLEEKVNNNADEKENESESEAVQEGDEEEGKDYKALKKEKVAQIRDAEKVLIKAQKKLDKLRNEHDALDDEMMIVEGETNTAHEIRRFIDSQNAIRKAQVEDRAKIASAVDEAFANKGKRPTRPNMNVKPQE